MCFQTMAINSEALFNWVIWQEHTHTTISLYSTKQLLLFETQWRVLCAGPLTAGDPCLGKFSQHLTSHHGASEPLNWHCPAQTVTQPPGAQQTARIRLPHLPGSIRGQFQLYPSCSQEGSNAPEQPRHLLLLRLWRFPSHSLIFSIKNKARGYPEYSPGFATDLG